MSECTMLNCPKCGSPWLSGGCWDCGSYPKEITDGVPNLDWSFWSKTCRIRELERQLDAAPRWHERPTCAGWWVYLIPGSKSWNVIQLIVDPERTEPFGGGWKFFGPIPEPEGAE